MLYFFFFFPDRVFQPKGFNLTLKKITFNQLRPIIFSLPLSLNRQTQTALLSQGDRSQLCSFTFPRIKLCVQNPAVTTVHHQRAPSRDRKDPGSPWRTCVLGKESQDISNVQRAERTSSDRGAGGPVELWVSQQGMSCSFHVVAFGPFILIANKCKAERKGCSYCWSRENILCRERAGLQPSK